MGWVLMIIASAVIILLLLLGLSLGKTARRGDDLVESTLRDLARIQDYYLGQPIDDAKDLREFTNEEYYAFKVKAPRMLIDEKIYYGTDVLFAGFNWDTTIGTTDGKIYKITLQTISLDKDNINYIFRHTLEYLFTKIGRYSEHRFLSTKYVWYDSDGNIWFDKVSKIGCHGINLILTSSFIRGQTLKPN